MIETPEELDRLLRVRVAHADYVGARGGPARIAPLEAPGSTAHGELREVGALAAQERGQESFWLGFAIRDREPAQGLYRIEIEGLPVHALLLVPSARQGGTTEYHASINRMSA